MTAYAFTRMYEDEFGWKIKDLGCVMLKVHMPIRMVIPDEWKIPENPEMPWIKNEISPHVTVLFGLLPFVKPSHCEAVLSDQLPDIIPRYVFPLGFGKFELGFGKFEYPKDANVPTVPTPYEVITLRLQKNPIEDMRTRLRYLPHIITFDEWHPHITLGYAKPGFFDELNLANTVLPARAQYTVAGVEYNTHMKENRYNESE